MEQVRASVITIGSEILYGHILDTNSQFIGDTLSETGIRVVLKASVGDERIEILEIFKYARMRSDLVLITGGLGPTNDDITKKALSEFFRSPLKMNREALEQVKAYFTRRGIALTDVNRRQAELPELAKVIENGMGTAPGMWIESDYTLFVSMPGVPHEMHHMLTTKIIPEIKKKYRTPVIKHKLIMTAGIGESWLAEKISDWEKDLPPNISLAYLPGYGQVKLRLSGTGDEMESLSVTLNDHADRLAGLIPKYVYGIDGIRLEERIGQILRNRDETLSLAESCTGGYIAHLITSVPGSSDYFAGGAIAYDNAVKVDQLGVLESTLESYGAVSEQTVLEMAKGCCKLFGTNYAVATSGIAGPSGGTPEKPVGTVWIGLADGGVTHSRMVSIPKDRINTIKFASVAALIFFWQHLAEKGENSSSKDVH